MRVLAFGLYVMFGMMYVLDGLCCDASFSMLNPALKRGHHVDVRPAQCASGHIRRER